MSQIGKGCEKDGIVNIPLRLVCVIKRGRSNIMRNDVTRDRIIVELEKRQLKRGINFNDLWIMRQTAWRCSSEPSNFCFVSGYSYSATFPKYSYYEISMMMFWLTNGPHMMQAIHIYIRESIPGTPFQNYITPEHLISSIMSWDTYMNSSLLKRILVN